MLKLPGLSLVLTCLASCTSTSKTGAPEKHDDTIVKIEAINDGSPFNASQMKFIVVPANEKDDANDLYFRRYAGMVARALVHRGFVPDSNPGKSTLRIKFAWSFGNSWTAVSGKKTRFQRTVLLKATKPDNANAWQVSLESWGYSRNPVKILPRMLEAGEKYFGLAFEGRKKENVSPDENDVVREIRGPLMDDSEAMSAEP